MVEVREGTRQDVAAFLPLVREYWSFEGLSGFEPERVAAALELLFRRPELGAGWLAYEGGAAVGYLLAVYAFSLEHLGLTAEIDEFFVAPTARGRGAGAALLRAAEAAFLRAGCANSSLQLARGNDAAGVFYRRHGYAERSAYELLEKGLRPA